MNNPQTQGSTGNGLGAGAGEAGGGDLKSSVGAVAEQVKAQGQERIESTRQATATTLEKLAEGVRDAASELERDGTVGNLSGYIAQMSDSLTSVASGLRDKSGDDLIQEVSRIARENPTVFVAGAVAIGFGLTRFARASTRREQGATQGTMQGGADVGSDLAGSATDIGASSTALSSAGERGGTSTTYSAGSLGGSGTDQSSGGLSAGAGLGGAASTGSSSMASSSSQSGSGLGSSSASQGLSGTTDSFVSSGSSGSGLSSAGLAGSSQSDGLDVGSRGLDARGDQQYASGGGSTPGLGTGTTPGLSAGAGASLGVRSGDENGGQGA